MKTRGRKRAGARASRARGGVTALSVARQIERLQAIYFLNNLGSQSVPLLGFTSNLTGNSPSMSITTTTPGLGGPVVVAAGATLQVQGGLQNPNGIGGPSFFQQNAGTPPAGVRVAEVETDGERSRRLIGGDLLTLLYTVQLGTIAVHPWQSRLPDIEYADYSTIDLDPGKDVPFARVVELAGRIREELEELELTAALKTSGSRGLHIVLPMPTRTSYARSAAIADRIARRVAEQYPRLATLERGIQQRPMGTHWTCQPCRPG